MFTELLNKKIYITDTLYLRYDIKAFIEAEENGISPFELTFPLPLDYIRAGLRCCFDELGADSVKRSEIVAYMIKELSLTATDVVSSIKYTSGMILPSYSSILTS